MQCNVRPGPQGIMLRDCSKLIADFSQAGFSFSGCRLTSSVKAIIRFSIRIRKKLKTTVGL